MEASREARVEVSGPRCPFCHERISPRVEKLACDACMAWHHAECWSEAGQRCGGCGAGVVSGSRHVPDPATQRPVGRAPTPAPVRPRRSCAALGCQHDAPTRIGTRRFCREHALRLFGTLLTVMGGIPVGLATLLVLGVLVGSVTSSDLLVATGVWLLSWLALVPGQLLRRRAVRRLRARRP